MEKKILFTFRKKNIEHKLKIKKHKTYMWKIINYS